VGGRYELLILISFSFTELTIIAIRTSKFQSVTKKLDAVTPEIKFAFVPGRCGFPLLVRANGAALDRLRSSGLLHR
jgi:hypothetical protein